MRAIGRILVLSLLPLAVQATPLDTFCAAYAPAVAPTEGRDGIRWPDSTRMPWDDGVSNKTFTQALDTADLQEQMQMPYPAGWPVPAPHRDADPGRFRFQPFFEKLYGGSDAAVRANLVSVPWLKGGRARTVTFNKQAGAADALAAVAKDLAALPAETQAYVSKPIGTFVWRPIARTQRLSPHSFGIAIDFELPAPLYLYWQSKAKQEGDPLEYPGFVLEDARLGSVVTAFEKHGFIWGGKWWHYDTMHFEYRPELLAGKP